MPRRLGALAALAALLAGAPGCGAPAQVRYEEELERTPAPAEHAVHGERLAELMRSLERLRGERLPQALAVGVERERRAEAVSEVALEMARSAARIPEVAPPPADAAQRAEFLASAALLERRARELAEAAAQRPPPPLDARFRALEATCADCHARFRGAGAAPAGDARPRTAP